jgi:hypothetical protein
MNSLSQLETSTPLYQKWTAPTRQKIGKDIGEFNTTINLPDKMDIYRLFSFHLTS